MQCDDCEIFNKQAPCEFTGLQALLLNWEDLLKHLY